MLAQERQLAIRARLTERGKVVAVELANEYGVSEDAIRRDLRELARQGFCQRVYGGALLPAPDAGNIGYRETASPQVKEGLAEVVSRLITDGQTVFIDASSTNIAIARKIRRDIDLTVFTNSPAIAIALSDHRRCKIILIGGVFNAEKGACHGAQTVREAKNIFAGMFILGACGIDTEVGITALDHDEVEVKRCFLQQSSRLVIALTKDKLGTVAPYKIGDVSAIDTLIVEGDVLPDDVAAYQEMGIKIEYSRIADD
ncbi:DeoR/GlpR family DNA-binding transcription regulator [Aureimonas phyllosphaerae]|uniref:DeoR/GlpR family transcriptional regulator of sugar metabolism n=1 Tax=Aureimonas phyllosphaerae TaxID=1166078 RepID=A0A7W6C4D4_9HYPH|nr:DeoR/GlpR family DNA-binding transcription regulator [Aureimonas phyllosphaerae]MBB3938217.1 DeoR/GlpR family transcriptional regulator of sugar metabolism [Aureimonas phyllosphaerae]MBB3962237.1 DeoR/GlpR family transcriptional regulator of sugar metabolism [Aureimonas phyllosphaerae]SFF58404.1 transcriptional regulator, DeoR family [Aureimonas phyllosphaerae]